jgi:hypothetical protein
MLGFLGKDGDVVWGNDCFIVDIHVKKINITHIKS